MGLLLMFDREGWREREKERESTGRGQRDSIIRGQGERQRGKQNLKRIPLAISHLGSKN